MIKKYLAVLSLLMLFCAQNIPVPVKASAEELLAEPVMPATFQIYTDTMLFEGYLDYTKEVTLMSCDSSLTSAEIPAEVTDPETGIAYPVKNVYAEAFKNCKDLQEITLAENQTNFQSIDGILCSQDGSKLLVYPQGKSVESVTVPEGIKMIEYYAFSCHPAKEIILPDSCTVAFAYAFGEAVEKIHLGKNFSSFNSSAFSGCRNLKEITISDNNPYFYLEDSVLYKSDKTELYLYPSKKSDASFTVPETVTEIGTYALNYCDALEEIILPENLKELGSSNLNYCPNLKTLTIPEGITRLYSIGNNCTNLETLYLPSTLDYVYYIFSKCGLKDVYVNNTRDYWYNMANVRSTAVLTYPTMHFSDDDDYQNINENGIDYRLYPDKAVVTGCDKELTDIIIPDFVQNVPVTEIHDEAFMSYKNLKSAEIPDSVTSIGRRAFQYSALESVKLPRTLENLGASAFRLTNLTEVCIPEGIQTLNSSIFDTCQKLKQVIIPEGVTQIDFNVFYGCEQLESVILPESLKQISNNAFACCSSLKEITLPENVTALRACAFRSCGKLEKITILNPNCYIEDYPETICNFYSETKLPPEGCIAEVEIHAEFSGIICGYEKSTAQAYAEQYHYQFEAISDTGEVQSGDADGNGKIDILDVIKVNKAVLGKEKLSSAQLRAIDFNGNGKPDASDSLLLMKYIVGLITSFD